MKFTSYNEAVEYLEINSRCNDYHNDIFRNQPKKKGQDGKKSSKSDSSYDVVDDYIFEEKGNFIVKKFKSKDSFIFGKFDSRDIACAARKILVDSNWKLDNQFEFSFYKDYCWVFEVYENKLLFIDKSESYEDAFDIITPSKVGMNKKYADDVEKSKSKVNLKVGNNRKGIKIWKPPYKKMVQKNIPQRIFVQKCSKARNESFIFNFNYFMGKIECVVSSVDKRQDFDAKSFPEFKLIIKILKTNDWNMSKIKESSSIYFYNDIYYKVQVIKDNTFVFDTFSSFYKAERSHLKCNKIRKIPFDINCPMGIDKLGDYYELVKFKNGKVYKVNRLRSLEKIKVIRDILIHSNWDFDIFYKYDLFYLNGIYWKFNRQGNIISLIEQF